MSAASLLALLRRLRAHGALSLRHLVRIGDADDIRTLVETGLAAPVGTEFALTREGAEFSFTDEPSLESLLDSYEQAQTVRNLQGLLETPEPASQLSDEDGVSTPHPALVRDWSTL